MAFNLPCGLAIVLAGIALLYVPSAVPVGVTLIILGAGWLGGYLLVEFARDRLPSVRAKRGERGAGMTLTLSPPRGGNRDRLRREASQLAADLHAYSRATPFAAQGRATFQQHTTEMRAATTEAERDAIWARHIAEEMAKNDQQAADATSRFGGRLHYVLDEFERLGIVTQETDRQLLEWHLTTSSQGSYGKVAIILEALARRL